MNPSEMRANALRPESLEVVRALLEDGPRETMMSSQVIHRGRVVTMRSDQAQLPDGQICGRDVLTHPGGMVILPILEDGSVIFIRQFRYALGHALIELPAGKRDPGETPLEGAHRELAEETGYRADAMQEMSCIYTSPGFCDERLWLFRARGLHPLDFVATADEEEHLHTVILTPAQVRAAIAERLIVDAKSICLLSVGLFWPEDEAASV